MQKPGHAPGKDQLFFRRELIERLPWFIRLRWAAVAAIVLFTAVDLAWRRELPTVILAAVSAGLALLNLVFGRWWAAISEKARDLHPFFILAHTQIGCDLAALFIVTCFTGGIASPVVIFFIFHVILAGILLPPVSCYVYGILILAALGALFRLQQVGLIPLHPAFFEDASLVLQFHPRDMLVRYAALAAAILISAYLVTTVKRSLRSKSRELRRVSAELDESNTRLRSLYDMVKEMSLCTDLSKLMDAATRRSAGIMGVKACSIKLLDEDRGKLRFASTYGLSEEYTRAKRQIDIAKEGIASMICLPLRVQKMVFGVFCIYSGARHDFGPEDVRFFTLMADLTAQAIENLKVQLDRTWFLRKAAHQLRAPYDAVSSMLKVLRQGYLGPVGPQQAEALLRCEKRIAALGRTIGDLLKLGIKRTEPAAAVGPASLDVRKALSAAAAIYTPQAAEKGVSLELRIADGVPAVAARAQTFDDLLENLISNAVKYTPPGGRITLGLDSDEDGWLRLTVADTGIGIARQDLPRLFTEFFRSENARALEEEGTGLGLVIVKEILDQLRGAVAVTSELGKGTSFICRIPAARRAGRAVGEGTQEAAGPGECPDNPLKKNGNGRPVP